MTNYKDIEKVYIMDFKYIKLKKDNIDNNTNNLGGGNIVNNEYENKGKLNFYIINK